MDCSRTFSVWITVCKHCIIAVAKICLGLVPRLSSKNDFKVGI